MRKVGLNVDGDCSQCHNEEETLEHLFQKYDLAKVYGRISM